VYGAGIGPRTGAGTSPGPAPSVRSVGGYSLATSVSNDASGGHANRTGV
jgi:hypothetical protein